MSIPRSFASSLGPVVRPVESIQGGTIGFQSPGRRVGRARAESARVFYTLQPGYNTHAGQLLAHSRLLLELSNALKAFLDDLTAAGLADRVTVLLFSEFGRTVAENGSAGTDHGTSGPVFLAGPNVKGGVVGATPSLLDLDPKYGDLKTVIDFRRIYATVLEDWLGLRSKQALGGAFESLPLFLS